MYTPLKKISPICTMVGAVPGALPVVLGWTAVRERVDLPSLALFAILFCWQFPHFHSIALVYQQDYARAHIRMLPVVEPEGGSTVRSILLYSFALVLVSFLPALFVPDGISDLAVAFALGSGLLWFGLVLWREHAFRGTGRIHLRARQLLLATVVYIPALFLALALSARA